MKITFKDTWFREREFRNFIFLYDFFAWGLMAVIVICSISDTTFPLYAFAALQFAMTLAINKAYKNYLQNIENEKKKVSKTDAEKK